MSEFKVGDIVAFDRDYKIRNPGVVDGHWTVEDVVDPVWSSYSMVRLSQEGRCDYMSWTYDLVLVPSERSRMIFPFEEPPEECERGEFEYQEVWAEPVSDVSEWMQPLRLQRRPVVHRASSGLRQPVEPGYAYVTISPDVKSFAFGWDRDGMYCGALPDPQPITRAGVDESTVKFRMMTANLQGWDAM